MAELLGCRVSQKAHKRIGDYIDSLYRDLEDIKNLFEDDELIRCGDCNRIHRSFRCPHCCDDGLPSPEEYFSAGDLVFEVRET